MNNLLQYGNSQNKLLLRQLYLSLKLSCLSLTLREIDQMERVGDDQHDPQSIYQTTLVADQPSLFFPVESDSFAV